MRYKLHDEETTRHKEYQEGREALLALQFEIASRKKQLCVGGTPNHPAGGGTRTHHAGGGTRTHHAGGGTRTHPAGSTFVRSKKNHSRAGNQTLARAFKSTASNPLSNHEPAANEHELNERALSLYQVKWSGRGIHSIHGLPCLSPSATC